MLRMLRGRQKVILYRSSYGVKFPVTVECFLTINLLICIVGLNVQLLYISIYLSLCDERL